MVPTGFLGIFKLRPVFGSKATRKNGIFLIVLFSQINLSRFISLEHCPKSPTSMDDFSIGHAISPEDIVLTISPDTICPGLEFCCLCKLPVSRIIPYRKRQREHWYFVRTPNRRYHWIFYHWPILLAVCRRRSYFWCHRYTLVELCIVTELRIQKRSTLIILITQNDPGRFTSIDAVGMMRVIVPYVVTLKFVLISFNAKSCSKL